MPIKSSPSNWSATKYCTKARAFITLSPLDSRGYFAVWPRKWCAIWLVVMLKFTLYLNIYDDIHHIGTYEYICNVAYVILNALCMSGWVCVWLLLDEGMLLLLSIFCSHKFPIFALVMFVRFLKKIYNKEDNHACGYGVRVCMKKTQWLKANPFPYTTHFIIIYYTYKMQIYIRPRSVERNMFCLYNMFKFHRIGPRILIGWTYQICIHWEFQFHTEQ